MEPHRVYETRLRWRSPNQVSLLVAVGALALALAWMVFSKYVVPPLIESAYRGQSLPALNRMITGQASHALTEYLSDWEQFRGSVLWGLALGGMFLLVALRPEFHRALRRSAPEQETMSALAPEEVPSEGWRTYLTVFLAYLALAVIFTLPGSLHPSRVLLGDGWDNYQHAWFLWEFARAVSHGQNPFRTDLIYYPSGADLSWATFDPLAGLMALPLSLSVGAVLAYNISLILQLALSAFFARLFCLRISRHAAAASIGGMIFGFSPYMLTHALGHLSLVTAFPIPLYVLALVRLLEKKNPTWKDGSLVGLGLLTVAFANYQCTVFILMFTMVILAMDFVRDPAALLKCLWVPLLVSAATFLVCFLPMLVILLRDGLPSPHPISEIEVFSADSAGFFVPSPFHWLFGRYVRRMSADFLAGGVERTVYIGFVALALAVLGCWSARDKQRPWAARTMVAGVLFAVLALGPTIHFAGKPTRLPAPANLLYKIDFMRFLRAPGRMSVIVMLCVALLATLGLAFLLSKLERRWQRVLLLCAIALGLLVEYGTYPFPSSSIVDPGLYTDETTTSQRCSLPASIQDSTVLTVPLFQWASWKKAMWMQMMDGGRYRLVEGYASVYVSPRVWVAFDEMPIIRSLHEMPAESLVGIRDRQFARFLRRLLHLGAVVVFDASDRSLEVNYVREVFGGKETRIGNCEVFEINRKPQH